jgi:hypothetical protein
MSVIVKAANVFPSFQRKAIARAGAIGMRQKQLFTIHKHWTLTERKIERVPRLAPWKICWRFETPSARTSHVPATNFHTTTSYHFVSTLITLQIARLAPP